MKSLLSALLTVAALSAQQSVPRPSFEVATVKLSESLDQGFGLGIAPAGNIFRANNTPLRRIILWAYELAPWQLSGGPAWVDSDRFTIEAKPERPASREEAVLMVQSLLAERFQLKMHRQTREMPLYTLRVDKAGPKLAPHQGQLGFQQRVSRGVPGHIVFQNVGMLRLANILKEYLDRAVLDETGLTGKYDFKLDWVPEQMASQNPAGPDLSAAIRQQLGLRLESGRGPVESFVIDSVDKPAAN